MRKRGRENKRRKAGSSLAGPTIKSLLHEIVDTRHGSVSFGSVSYIYGETKGGGREMSTLL